MTGFFRATDLGTLEVLEVYDYFDGPRLLACRNLAGQVFLGLWTGTTVESLDTWLFLPMSSERFASVRSGAMEIRTAFLKAEDGTVYQVLGSSGGESARCQPLPVQAIDVAILPDPGERLALRPEQLASSPLIPAYAKPLIHDSSVRLRDLSVSAQQGHRDLINLVVERLESGRTEVRARFLAEILQDFQGTLDAIGRALRVRGGLDLQVVTTLHASFGIQLAAPSQLNMFGSSPVSTAVERLIEMLSMGADEDRLRATLAELKVGTARRYRTLLKRIADAGFDMDFEWSSVDPQRARAVQVSVVTARNAVDVLFEIEEELPSTYLVFGELVAVNRRLKTFELIDDSKERFAGKILDEAFSAASRATISDKYTATIKEVSETNPITSEVRIKYYLVGLEGSVQY